MLINKDITKKKILAAQRVLMDNGIDPDDTSEVMYALGAVLFDTDIEELIEYDGSKLPYNHYYGSIWDQPGEIEKFKDIKEGDYVVVHDTHLREWIEHIVHIHTVEYDENNITDNNPKGKVCYGYDVSDSGEETSIGGVDESNFIRFAEDSEIIREIRATSIKWNTDGEKADLPTQVVIPENYCLDDVISDYLSDEYGYCHNGYKIKRLTNNDLDKEHQKLKRKIYDAGVNAIEEFLNHPLDYEAESEYMEAMDEYIAQMPEEEYFKYLKKYKIA